jgi:hypothetical protein
MTVRSFARSNQDLPSRFRRRDNSGNGGNSYYYNSNNGNNVNRKRSKSSENDPKYSSSGAIEQPILAMGELSYAQTYAGGLRCVDCGIFTHMQCALLQHSRWDASC